MATTYDIYRNLNKARREPKRNVWSLRTKVNGRPKVVGHAENVMLTDVVFKVSESTRQRVIDRQRKSVCAFVRGGNRKWRGAVNAWRRFNRSDRHETRRILRTT
jgi:hypothetical protein